jgi:hypothetical protein
VKRFANQRERQFIRQVFDALDVEKDGELELKELVEQCKTKFDFEMPKKVWSSAFK